MTRGCSLLLVVLLGACSDDGGPGPDGPRVDLGQDGPSLEQGAAEQGMDAGTDAAPDALPASRPFQLAASPVTSDPQAGTFYTFAALDLATDVDVIALHQDFLGVPWQAFSDGDTSDLPAQWVAEVDALEQLVKAAGKPVFLSLALVGGSGRGTLAARPKLQNGKLGTEDDWAGPCFNFNTHPDGAKWRKAYLEYVKYMVTRFKPAFVNHAIEVNLFAAKCDATDKGAFDAVMQVADAAYAAAKQAQPQAVVFPSFQIDSMRDVLGDGWCDKGSESACFTEAYARVKAMKRDRFGVSTYPYVAATAGTPFRSSWLDEVAQATAEQLVVAETGAASTDLVYNAGTSAQPSCQVHLAASEATQQVYLAWLLDEARRLDMDLVTWWSDRDIYPHAFNTGCPCSAPQDYCTILGWFRSLGQTPQQQVVLEIVFRLFESMGLRRHDGTPKLALATWNTWLALPVQ